MLNKQLDILNCQIDGGSTHIYLCGLNQWLFIYIIFILISVTFFYKNTMWYINLSNKEIENISTHVTYPDRHKIVTHNTLWQ